MADKKGLEGSSLKVRLMLAFIITSIIPIIIINLISYYNTSRIVRDNARELTRANLRQTDSTLDVWLESYEDILYQVYTDDDIVSMVNKINAGEDMTVVRNQLRRTLRGLFFSKEYVKSITIITEDGTEIFYDLLTGSTTRNSWIGSMDLNKETLYETVSNDNATHIFSTQNAIPIGANRYYLFHLGHRIIDYRNVDKRMGIVIVSVDEELLHGVCSSGKDISNSFNFIVDSEGRIVSYPEKNQLALRIMEWNEDEELRREGYREFINGKNIFSGKHVAVDSVHSERFGWDIINVSNQNEIIKRLNDQQKITFLILILSLAALTSIIAFLTRSLTGSLQNLAYVMKRAGTGELSVRVNVEKGMPAEVRTITLKFNNMLDKLEESKSKENEANEKLKSAEIAALEAQINPHFLYNTLDTINWMAIDRDEYEISNAINSLAVILRYGINNSNGIVTVREECEWLRQYLFLQQTRLKNTFECDIHIDPEILERRIHKLLLQPFVENAILHGFEGVKRKHCLVIDISKKDGGILSILIFDNGRGIENDRLEQMNMGIFPQCLEKNHIGMENAISRIHMYYGKDAKVRIESRIDEFTRISIEIPVDGSTT